MSIRRAGVQDNGSDLERVEVDRTHEEDRVAHAVPVRIEPLSGVSARRLPQFRRLLSALPVFFPSGQVWLTMERWVEASAARVDSRDSG
jgi:hypothetical protein